MSIGFDAAMNAARIMAEYPDAPEVELGIIETCEAVAEAAETLAAIEAGKSFDWENQGNDWESACAAIAYMISRDGEAPDKGMIRESALLPERKLGNEEDE